MESLDTAQFQSPVPGMSLTTEPGARPWEKPAKYTTAEDALKFYVDKLTVPDRSAELLSLLELGYPVTNLIDMIVLNGVMEGTHSIDVGIVISPALYELITGMADSLEIEYKDGVKDLETSAPKTLLSKASKITKAQQLAEEIEKEDLENYAEAAQSGLMSRKDLEENIEDDVKTFEEII